MLKSQQISQIGNPFKENLTKSHEEIFQNHYFNLKSNKNLTNNKLPIAIYNSGFSPNQLPTDFSVKLLNATKTKIDDNKVFTGSPYQQNINNDIFPSNNLYNSYSDLHTSASFSSQKSSESFFANNNKSQYMKKNFVFIPNNLNLYQSPEKLTSSLNYKINLNNSNCFNTNQSTKTLSNLFNNGNNTNNIIMNPNLSQNFSSILNLTKNNSLLKEKHVSNFNINNIFNSNNKTNNESKYFQTQKSIDFSDKKILNNDEKIKPKIINPNNGNGNINGFQRNINNNIENSARKKSKSYYNKFNASKENGMNENTVILTLKIKVAKNDYRVFNLKKYDDLFVSLEKFVDLNKIKQDLVKPLVSKIFNTLNKIFWLLNNKIGIYDQEYLHSLYKLWIKNNREIPKTRNKNHSDKSTTSSSESSNDSIGDAIKSNSYQNSDGNSSEDKDRKLISKSF